MIKEKLRDYLGIKEEKDWSKDFADIEKKLWNHQTLLEERVKIECPVCKKTLILWPLASESYYTKEGKHYHIKCYEMRNSR